MNEKLLADYIQSELHRDDVTAESIDTITTAGHLVILDVFSSGYNPPEAFQIDLLDIIAWVHSNQSKDGG